MFGQRKTINCQGYSSCCLPPGCYPYGNEPVVWLSQLLLLYFQSP
jgi:hypothetical protein